MSQCNKLLSPCWKRVYYLCEQAHVTMESLTLKEPDKGPPLCLSQARTQEEKYLLRHLLAS